MCRAALLLLSFCCVAHLYVLEFYSAPYPTKSQGEERSTSEPLNNSLAYSVEAKDFTQRIKASQGRKELCVLNLNLAPLREIKRSMGIRRCPGIEQSFHHD